MGARRSILTGKVMFPTLLPDTLGQEIHVPTIDHVIPCLGSDTLEYLRGIQPCAVAAAVAFSLCFALLQCPALSFVCSIIFLFPFFLEDRSKDM